MSCEKMATRILGYADGSLKESERREVEKHLASCAPCSLRLKEFRAVSDLNLAGLRDFANLVSP